MFCSRRRPPLEMKSFDGTWSSVIFLVGSLSLNDQLLDESAKMALTTRAEKLMWIAADEHLLYGEVVSLLRRQVKTARFCSGTQ